jgi:hypothetical protein
MGPGLLNVEDIATPLKEPVPPGVTRVPPPASSLCAPETTEMDRMFCMVQAGVHSAPLAFAVMPFGPCVVYAPPSEPAHQIKVPALGGAVAVPTGQSDGQGQDTGSAAPPKQYAPAGHNVPVGAEAPIQHALPAGTAVQLPEHVGEVSAVALPYVPSGQGSGNSAPAGQ